MELLDQSQLTVLCAPFVQFAILSALQALQFVLLGLANPIPNGPYELVEYDNFLVDENIMYVDLSLNLPETGAPDEWNSSTIIRKIGMILWGGEPYKGELQYINATTIRMTPPSQPITGACINLQPGVTGTAYVYTKLTAGTGTAIVISYDGGDTWVPLNLGGDEFSGGFPF